MLFEICNIGCLYANNIALRCVSSYNSIVILPNCRSVQDHYNRMAVLVNGHKFSPSFLLTNFL